MHDEAGHWAAWLWLALLVIIGAALVGLLWAALEWFVRAGREARWW